VVEVLREAGVTDCVYGHLHGADHALGVNGLQDGIRYHLVSADAIAFEPTAIVEAGDEDPGEWPDRAQAGASA
jgi:hypothetical protein